MGIHFQPDKSDSKARKSIQLLCKKEENPRWYNS